MFKILDHIIKKRYDCSNYVDEIENKELGPANMLDVLVQLQNQESCSSNHHGLHLTNNHLKAVTADFLSAGTETVATTMEWALSELVKNPRVMEKAQAEVRERFEGKMRIEEADIENLNYLKLVVKESLRLHPPGVLLPREARETCEIGGYEIPVQTNIIVNVNWTEPDVFKPERFLDTPVDFKGTDYEFLPFGAGRRYCPGISFTTANIELALAQLLYHFDLSLPHGIKPEEFDMRRISGLLSRESTAWS